MYSAQLNWFCRAADAISCRITLRIYGDTACYNEKIAPFHPVRPNLPARLTSSLAGQPDRIRYAMTTDMRHKIISRGAQTKGRALLIKYLHRSTGCGARRPSLDFSCGKRTSRPQIPKEVDRRDSCQNRGVDMYEVIVSLVTFCR